MAVFVNWFEIKFAQIEASFPCRTFPSWQEAREFADQNKFSEFIGLNQPEENEGELLVLLEKIDPPKGFIQKSFNLQADRSIGARVISLSISRYLEKRGCRIRSGRFGNYATTEQFQISDIGFSVSTGISFKPHYIGYKSIAGITLNWHTEQEFFSSVADMVCVPKKEFTGLPVIWHGDTPDDFLAEKKGRYIGVILSIDSATETAKIRCRDQHIRSVPTKSIRLEARKEIVSKIASFSKEATSASSLEKRIAVLSFAEKPAGGKNFSILRDRLKSAVNFLCPGGKQALFIDLEPELGGKLRIEMAPATAEMK